MCCISFHSHRRPPVQSGVRGHEAGRNPDDFDRFPAGPPAGQLAGLHHPHHPVAVQEE